MRAILGVALLASFLFLFRLGSTGIIYPSNEPRRMLLAKDMVNEHHWVVPHLLGKPYIHKPPMLIWLLASSYRIIGRTDLWSTRVPTALVGILGVVVTALFGRALFGREVGIASGLILATSPLWIERARLAEEDVVLALWVVLALYAFWLGWREGKGKLYLAFYFFMACGCMTKLASGLIFPGLAVTAFLLGRRELRAFLRMKPLWGLLILCGLVLPWYLYAYHLVGFGRAEGILLEDTWYKVFPTHGGKPPYHYLLSTFPYFLPWSLFLPAAAVFFWQERKKLDDRGWFLLAWIVPNLLFFSLAGAKRDEYILPLYPALAISVAFLWREFLRGRGSALFKRVFALGCKVFTSLVILGAIGLLSSGPFLRSLPLARSPGGLKPLLLGGGLMLCGLWAFLGVRRGNYRSLFPSLVTVGVLLFLVHNLYITPAFLWYKTPHPFCDRAKEVLQGRVPYLFRGGGLYLQNEWDGRLQDISLAELKERLLRGEQIYLLTEGRGIEILEREGIPFQLLLQQKPFLKRRWDIALVRVKGYNNNEESEDGSKTD